MLRFRSFRSTLLTLFVATVAAIQIATYIVVVAVNQRAARQEIAVDLATAASAFERITADRTQALARSASAVASDYAFRQNYFTFIEDPKTLQSAFESARGRIDADLNAWVDLDGVTITAHPAAEDATFRDLVFQADESEDAQATGYLDLHGQLFAVVVVPIRAPAIVGWWVVGTQVDRGLAARLHELTGVGVSFANAAHALVASSLDAPTAAALGDHLPALPTDSDRMQTVTLSGAANLLKLRPVPLADGGTMLIALQYSLDEKLAPARRLSRLILGISLGGLGLACLGGVALARRVSQPVQALAAHTRVIAAGDYATPLHLDRADELGDLARAFNHMSTGLAERDRVRDLLDKNVSPEVAAQLLRDGAALGGEEREVTILFADLRGFTTFSENQAPPAVVAVLNRYLDRMATAIEAEGGVIDKFIGDEIMALFGAPVAVADAAPRAVRAALAMRTALVALNLELSAEGRPPLAFGIGINTGRVVAGNIGSQRRLNYSVIGDGVNLAARLQTLTRNPIFAADLIVSDVTLQAIGPTAAAGFAVRDLGTVTVKGRAEGVHIHALDALP